ncbi:hypothetical protein ABH917_000039 [Thermobifida halotolerans]
MAPKVGETAEVYCRKCNQKAKHCVCCRKCNAHPCQCNKKK